MTDIQVVEVRHGARRAALRFNALTLESFRQAREPTAAPTPTLRIYARDSGDSVGLPFLLIVNTTLKRLSRPQSALRATMQRYWRDLDVAAPAHRWFVFHQCRSLLEPIDSADATAALSSAAAALEATRDIARQGDLVVEVLGHQRSTFEALFDQVWQDVGATDAQPTTPDEAPSGEASPAPLSPFDAARQRRETLLGQGWPTSRAVAEQLGSRARNPAQYAADLRADGRLLGTWSAAAGTFVHPTCQFDEAGQVRPEMRQLLSILPAEGDDGGWRRAFWLYGPRDALEGRAPADVLATDPARVLELARLEFAAEGDA